MCPCPLKNPLCFKMGCAASTLATRHQPRPIRMDVLGCQMGLILKCFLRPKQSKKPPQKLFFQILHCARVDGSYTHIRVSNGPIDRGLPYGKVHYIPLSIGSITLPTLCRGARQAEGFLTPEPGLKCPLDRTRAGEEVSSLSFC